MRLLLNSLMIFASVAETTTNCRLLNIGNEVQFDGGFEGWLNLSFEGELVGDKWQIRAHFDRPVKRLQATLFQDGSNPVELTPYKTTPFASTWHFINSLVTFPEYVITGSGITVWIAVEWDSDNLTYAEEQNYETYIDYENYEKSFLLCRDRTIAQMASAPAITDKKDKL